MCRLLMCIVWLGCFDNVILYTAIPKAVLAFVKNGVVPDVLETPPVALLDVIFPSGALVQAGDEILLDQVVQQPQLHWDANPGRFYTILFIGTEKSSYCCGGLVVRGDNTTHSPVVGHVPDWSPTSPGLKYAAITTLICVPVSVAMALGLVISGLFQNPDVSSRENAEYRSFLHWLVVNVPGNDINSGDTLAYYINPKPRPGTGLHRYVFLVYEQPGWISFNGLPDYTDLIKRTKFSPEEFSKRYNLGTLIAGNLYQSKNYDIVL